MSEVRRIRFNRTLFSIPMNGHTPMRMLAQLVAEDIELILDIRETSAVKQFDQLCEEANVYYVHRPTLSMLTPEKRGDGRGGIETTSWAAGLSMRHRTCVVGDDDDRRLELSKEIASYAGQRLVDIEASPAPITMPEALDEGTD